jgi:O-antigen/teichoic acid export membrane protein
MIAGKIAKNTLWQIAGKFAGFIAGFLVIMILTRSLGKEGFGGFTTITTYLQFFGIIVDFGLTLVAVQMLSIPNVDEKKTFDNIFTLKIISAGIFFGISILIAWLLPYPHLIKVGITIASAAFFMNAIQQVYVGWYQKYLYIKKLATAEVLGKITLLIGVAIVASTGGGLLRVMPILIIHSAVYLVLTMVFVKNHYKPSFAIDKDVWKEIMRRSYPIALGIFFNLIYLKGDTLVLSLTRPQGDVGIYGASFRLIEVLITLPMMFAGLLLPQLTKYWEEGNKEFFKKIFQQSYNIIHIVIWPFILGGIALAVPLIDFIAGNEFAESAPVMQILLIAFAAIAISTLFGHIIVALEKQKKAIWMYAITALATVIWYLVYIPKYTYWAAALITLGSEIAIAFLLMILVHHITGIKLKQKIALQSVFAAIIMFVIISIIPLHFSFLIIIGAITYIASLTIITRKTPKQLLRTLSF